MEVFRNAVNRVSSFDVYCGTTLENFRTCAIESEGVIKYDKRREERYHRSEFYWASYFERAEIYATLFAESLNNTPLVMKGRIPIRYFLQALVHFEGNIPTGYLFPVKKMWLPKERLDWYGYDPKKRPAIIKEAFQEKDPREFLI